MKRNLCSHWALGPAQANWVKKLGFSGIRYDMPLGMPEKLVRKSLKDVRNVQLNSLIILGGWSYWNNTHNEQIYERKCSYQIESVTEDAIKVAHVAKRAEINNVNYEIGNEPDGSNWSSPEYFAEVVNSAAEAIWKETPDVTVISGGIGNVDKESGAKYLEAMMKHGLLKDIAIGVHPYRGDRKPHEAPKGWKSLREMFRWLRGFHREFHVTECGWHTAEQTKKCLKIFSRKIRWTDEQVAEFAVTEMKLWERAGCRSYAYYCMDDGEEDTAESRYGIRYTNLKPKPVAEAFERIGSCESFSY